MPDPAEVTAELDGDFISITISAPTPAAVAATIWNLAHADLALEQLAAQKTRNPRPPAPTPIR